MATPFFYLLRPKPCSHSVIYLIFHTLCPIRKISLFYLENICRTLTFLSTPTWLTLVQAIIIAQMGDCNRLLTDLLTFSFALLASYLKIAARGILFKHKLYQVFSLLKMFQRLYILLVINAKVFIVVL